VPAHPDYQVEKFTIAIPDDSLKDMNERLRMTRFPQDFANDDWRYGYNTGYHRSLVDYWVNEYDWRDVERRMNELPHFKTEILGSARPLHPRQGQGRQPGAVVDPPRLAVDVLGSAQGDRSIDRSRRAHGGDPADSFDVVLISFPGTAFPHR
jgi:hypothetical protein